MYDVVDYSLDWFTDYPQVVVTIRSRAGDISVSKSHYYGTGPGKTWAPATISHNVQDSYVMMIDSARLTANALNRGAEVAEELDRLFVAGELVDVGEILGKVRKLRLSIKEIDR